MANVEIKWMEADHSHYDGGLVITLPEGWETIDFLRKITAFNSLVSLLGCEDCPLFETDSGWADVWIKPGIGHRDDDKRTVDVVCEGHRNSAKGRGKCIQKFGNPQTVELTE